MMNMAEQGTNYLIADKTVAAAKVPEIRLPDMQNTGAEIGVLLGREDAEHYEIDKCYIRALQNAGATNIRLLSYDNIAEQAKDLSGIVLVGGAFDSPPEWEETPSQTEADKRFRAYESLIRLADHKNLPVLGICAGFQMMIGVMNPKTMHIININTLPNALVHKEDKTRRPHSIVLQEGTRLFQLFGREAEVNSFHRQGILATDVAKMSDVMPVAVSADGILEAVYFQHHPNWTAVQFHPEVLACHGDEKMQNIFNMFVQDVSVYEQNKQQEQDKATAEMQSLKN